MNCPSNRAEELLRLIREYNQKVFAPYEFFVDAELQKGGDVHDSFDGLSSEGVLKTVSQMDFMIVGAGPAGLFLAVRLSEEFPQSRTIVYDNRTTVEHRRTYVRHRYLFGLSMRISELEERLFAAAQEADNVKFLFSSDISPESLLAAVRPSFVFNASGGRLKLWQNPVSEEVKIGDKSFAPVSPRVWQDPRSGMRVPVRQDRLVFGSDTVAMVSQGNSYLDVWVTRPAEVNRSGLSLAETVTTLESLGPKGIGEDLLEFLRREFSPGNFDLVTFETGTRISIRQPAAVHRLPSESVDGSFVKLDVGDSLATVGISYGSNIEISQGIVDEYVLPLVKSITGLKLDRLNR
ncbi:MAG: hypothetical protein ACYCOU_11515 [Sulfobacillus sp.]